MKINDINDLAVMIVSLVLAIVLLLTGCGADTVNNNNNVENKDNYEANYMQEYRSFNFYVDEETCVEYIVSHDTYEGGITPRLNDDGTLKLNKNCLKDGSK